MGIKNWPEDERPREKLLRLGPSALSAAEILAIILHTGSRKKNAVSMARDLLKRFGGITGLGFATDAELLSVPGIGPAKVTQLRAARLYGGLIYKDKAKESPILGDPDSISKLVGSYIQDPGREEFWVLMLDKQNRLIEMMPICMGTLNKSKVYPREVIKPALNHQAVKVIFAHNHPSGDTMPSENDLVVTKRLVMACRAVGIEVVDHGVVGKGGYFSFRERGLLKNEV